MKKNLFLRLCLMFLVGFSAFSCRTEEFHNEEETHGNAGLRLTSQRISLSQAKHRTQLLPDLEKAETAIEKKKLNMQGKSVNIGNGITIDTDEVIYMENGPDYHTYTFSVIRDNAPANAPVENILMTPNTDGSYRVFHIVLNLTEADKAKIANREYVDYKNKQQVTELAGINLSSLTQKQICVPYYYSFPVACVGPEHHMPGEAGCPLEGNDRAYWGSIVLYDCFGEEPETFMPTPIPIDGGGGGGGVSPEEGGQNPPYECTSAATDPTQVGLVSPTGCYIGMPSEPIVRTNPCEKTKALLESPDVEAKIKLMKDKSKIGGEIGVNIKADGTTSDTISGGAHEVEMGDTAGYQGGYHNHTPTGVKMLSPPDIKKLLNYAISQPNGNISNAFFGMVGSEPCTGNAPSCENGFMYHNYIIRFSGTITELTQFLYNTNWDDDILISDYQKTRIDLSEDLSYAKYKFGPLNSNGLQKLFFDTLSNMGLNGKVILQRVDYDGTIQNIIENNNGGTTATPCP
ncbi:hypothetical protein [Chryseobacterium echinoideorum]|uniref:hypothetical protein n=1 Tax=Chryseobacterium echinoideorum TaxID=1549648 RepID=UPI0011857B9A|nr:hypothetical protein [Chryseobacterium echinoideorum]